MDQVCRVAVVAVVVVVVWLWFVSGLAMVVQEVAEVGSLHGQKLMFF